MNRHDRIDAAIHSLESEDVHAGRDDDDGLCDVCETQPFTRHEIATELAEAALDIPAGDCVHVCDDCLPLWTILQMPRRTEYEKRSQTIPPRQRPPLA